MSTDMETIRNQMDLANALRYLKIPGADIYVVRTGESAPKAEARNLLTSVHQAVAGVSNHPVIQWITNREEAVPAELAAARAKICVDRNGVPCPQHGKGDWTRYFTEPASRAIKAEYERREQMKLSTPYDDKLQICDACQCPLKLKVHIPLERCLQNLTGEQKGKLDPLCWMLHEAEG